MPNALFTRNARMPISRSAHAGHPSDICIAVNRCLTYVIVRHLASVVSTVFNLWVSVQFFDCSPYPHAPYKYAQLLCTQTGVLNNINVCMHAHTHCTCRHCTCIVHTCIHNVSKCARVCVHARPPTCFIIIIIIMFAYRRPHFVIIETAHRGQ